MNPTSRTLLALASGGALLAGSAIAIAAEPDKGTISASSPKVTWTGEVVNSYFNRVPMAVTEDDSVPCGPSTCDAFELTLQTPGNLTILANVDAEEDNPGAVTVRVRNEGNATVFSSDADSVSENKPYKIVIKNAKAGVYDIEYTNNFAGPVTYKASAELPGATPVPSNAAQSPAGAPQSSPAQQGTPGPVQPPQQTSSSFTLTVKAAKTSARKAKRSRKVFASVSVDREVQSATASLKKGKTVIGKGKLGTFNGTKKLTVKLSKKAAKKLKKGKFSLTVAAKDGQGVTVIKTVAVKITK